MSDHDSSSSSPSPPPHDATALLPPPPSPPRGGFPFLTSHPATAESCGMSLPPSPGQAALDPAPSPPCLLLPPAPLDGHGGSATTEAHFLDFLPPGYRFHPLDEELLTHYLGNKIGGQPLPPNKIYDVRLYDHNPESLAAKYQQWGENKWFFFTPRDRKYPNGNRPNRAAGDGYWKATGSDKPVIGEGGAVVGSKKALVFYRGKPPDGDKTNWIMNEYRIEDANQRRHDGTMKLDDWVLCSIHGSAEGNERRTKRRRVETKEPRPASWGKRGDKKPQPSDSKQYSHIDQAASVLPSPKPDMSSDEGPNILQSLDSNNYTIPHEDNKSAHLLQLAPYLHATLPYQYFQPNGSHYHESFSKIGDLPNGSNERLSSVEGLTDALPWTTDHQFYWMPETLDYASTKDDVNLFLDPSAEHGGYLDNAWGLNCSCLEPAGNLMSCADAADAVLANLSYYSGTDPFGNTTDVPANSQTYAAIGDIFGFEGPNAPAVLDSGFPISAEKASANAAPAVLRNDEMISKITFQNSPHVVFEDGAVVPGSCAGVNAGAKCGDIVPE
ncbi:hypothetical protein Taro_030369 [Colocasia esculenta]|uniref:NAC domain-containing protein n=1 Tax=Colocasia esculenta TaxID=4460 RepID=A0A843VG73_COLES|nr:hypothetical protein [Colocasia esculenta]